LSMGGNSVAVEGEEIPAEEGLARGVVSCCLRELRSRLLRLDFL
jgi:hypothetical protein